MVERPAPNTQPAQPNSASQVQWLTEPSSDSPILIVALQGLFDIGGAATDAVDHLVSIAQRKAHVASIDPEHFYDFTQQRPTVSIEADGSRLLRWPANDAYGLTLDGPVDSLVTISGIEPHLRWRTFSAAVGEIAQRSGARLVVTLGAMAGQAPHTRALGVVGSASDAVLAKRLGLGRPSYQGPTGLAGALNVHLHEIGLAVISLRVSVPHYVTQSPNAEATRSLLARLELVTGIVTKHEQLDADAAEWRSRVDAAVASDAEMTAYVQRLEAMIDSSDDLLPSGDELANQLQAWLRDNG